MGNGAPPFIPSIPSIRPTLTLLIYSSPETQSGIHKRGRSMRSLLHKVSSKADMESNTANPLTPTKSSSSNKPDTGSPLSQTTSVQDLPTRPVPAPQTSVPASIEQSVKLFRVYESLRKGDTAAISRVLREESGVTSGEERRGSATSGTGVASSLDGTTLLHLAVQCADSAVIEYVLANSNSAIDINTRDKDGNTPLHVAANLSRVPVVRLLLEQEDINDSLMNYQGQTAIDLAKSPEVFQQLQLARSMYIDEHVTQVHQLVSSSRYEALEKLFIDPHFQSAVDVNGGELATDPAITQSGGTLLHEAAKKKDAKLIQILLLNGADPFRRDKKGKLPQDITKDDKTRALLKKSPAAAAAQRGIQEKTILGASGAQAANAGGAESNVSGKEAREMKGYLKKWTNYTSGYKLRWFVLEDGVLSYYKHQGEFCSKSSAMHSVVDRYR